MYEGEFGSADVTDSRGCEQLPDTHERNALKSWKEFPGTMLGDDVNRAIQILSNKSVLVVNKSFCDIIRMFFFICMCKTCSNQDYAPSRQNISKFAS